MASILALLSSALWGSADFFAGRMSKKHHPFAVLGFSQVIGLGVGLLIVLISRDTYGQAFGLNGYVLSGALAGLFGYIGLACLYEGLSTGRMGVVAPISSMSAVIPLPIKPLLLALGAAAGFGMSLTFMSIGSKESALLTMVSMRAATFFVTISLALKFRTTGKFSKKDLPILIFIGAADFLANLLLGVATTKGLVSVAMVFGSLYPIATALLAFKFLNERLHKVQYVGIALAVSGVSLISAF